MFRGKSPFLVSVLAVAALLSIGACVPAAAPATQTAAPAKAGAPAETTKPPPPPPLTPPPKPDKITLTTTSIGGVDLPALVAQKKGFFAQENIEAEILVVRMDVALKALLAGEFGFIFGLDSPVRAAVQGLGVKVLMVTVDKPYHELVVRAEIREGKDLKGKTIAIAGIGGTTLNMLKAAMEHYGLDAERDATTVAMAEAGQRLAALKGGAVQGAILSPPATFEAEAQGLKRMLKIADVMESPLGAINTSDKLIRERPDVVLRAVRASMKGLKYIKDPQNKDEIINLWVTEAKMSKDAATHAYPDNARSFSDNDGIVSEKVMRQEIQRAQEDAEVKGDVPFSKVFDYSFVNQVKQER